MDALGLRQSGMYRKPLGIFSSASMANSTGNRRTELVNVDKAQPLAVHAAAHEVAKQGGQDNGENQV